jgi:hypothetical protein
MRRLKDPACQPAHLITETKESGKKKEADAISRVAEKRRESWKSTENIM